MKNPSKYLGNELKYLKLALNKKFPKNTNSWQQSFEEKFARKYKKKFAITFNSGTSTLHAALISCGVKPGDEVISPALTVIMDTSATIHSHAIPVYADIDEDDYTIKPSEIEKKITKKTKAIIAVHIYGNPVDIKELIMIKKKHKITLIEDCAQAHGAEYDRKKVGNFGDFACFSFYPTKNLSTFGDGGAVSTNSSKMYKKIKLLREYGWIRKNFSSQKGSNKRLDELHASILSVKLEYLNQFNNKRILIANKYLKSIKSKKLILPKLNSIKKNVFHLFVVRLKSNQRSNFLNHLKKNNIFPGIHYPLPNHQQIPFKKYSKSKLYVTEKISKEIVSIPNYPLLKTREVNKIIKVINSF